MFNIIYVPLRTREYVILISSLNLALSRYDFLFTLS